jgi:hypothetical protein
MALRDRLREARHERFVGRAEERARFASALEAEVLPFHVLYLHGPGGVGKTALLREFQHAARDADVPSFYLDARHLEPTPAAFATAVDGELPGAGRAVLLVDTYEVLHGLDEWLRESFLPSISDDLIVVLASRHAPNVAWRSDLGWQEVVCTLPLRNLAPEESRALLEARGVPADEHDAILHFTHGHPLALALIADRPQGAPFAPDGSPDIVGTLLKRFMDEVPREAERAALEAASVVRVVTEPLLASLLGRDEEPEAFAWLRELSFVEASGEGLFLHDLVREVLAADLRWRRPDRHAALERCARAYYTRGLLTTDPERGQQELLADYMFLHRHNEVVRPLFRQLREHWSQVRPQRSGPPRAGEWGTLRAVVAEHEGEAAAAIAAYWFERQPEHVQVFRDEEGGIRGFLFSLALDATTAAQRAADPAADAVWAYLEEHAPLRAEERATLFRFWMDCEHHQTVSAVQSLIFVATVRHYLRTEGLAFTFLPCADPDFWAPIFTFVGLSRLDADFEVGERRYGVYGHDWRAVPPGRWLEGLAEQGLPPTELEEPGQVSERLLVLSRPEFAEAVQEALRDFARPHELKHSPLLRSRLVVDHAGDGDRVEALRALLNEAAEELNTTPREASYYLALDATYLDPARTQAEAADQLDMAFSTYRRYLKRGVEHVVEALWERELTL